MTAFASANHRYWRTAREVQPPRTFGEHRRRPVHVVEANRNAQRPLRTSAAELQHGHPGRKQSPQRCAEGGTNRRVQHPQQRRGRRTMVNGLRVVVRSHTRLPNFARLVVGLPVVTPRSPGTYCPFWCGTAIEPWRPQCSPSGHADRQFRAGEPGFDRLFSTRDASGLHLDV
jgi:hypothetical protein